jgi:hypothetical protein
MQLRARINDTDASAIAVDCNHVSQHAAQKQLFDLPADSTRPNPTYAWLAANDCYGCGHCAVLPHNFLYLQCRLQVLGIRHACRHTTGESKHPGVCHTRGKWVKRQVKDKADNAICA